ncbi:hypothetical protein BV898_12900 [Hypsibius exemplaris]|uniref:SAMD1-like winged helix (WH) domain-containing protein n=1 Tax=Hypsibius exemplaris TaxID=2072580 RepID=A0A1W0WCE8_HYPEX|nr:hypothetical protein BV898_12900 [Hypsibius exemplaris]
MDASLSVSPAKGTVDPRILEFFRDSIKRIKNQKQRPSFDRIAQTLKTHHGCTNRAKIQNNLDMAIRDGLLLPVWTKGQECYKDPENLKSLRKFTVKTPADIRRAVKAAVREIGDPLGSYVPTIANYVRYSFSIGTPHDLEAGVIGAVSTLAGKGDLIKQGERYRTCHVAALDSPAKRNGQDSASALLDAEEEDDEDEMEPARIATTSPKRSSNTEATWSSSNNDVSPPKKDQMLSSNSKNEHSVVEASSADRGKLNAVLKKARPEESKQHSVRRFLRFQCWCCRFFTTSEQDLMKHVSGRSHEERTRKRIIYCNTCCFRTRNRSKLLDHLKKHNCHADKKDVSPACLLTFGIFTSFTLTD